jgi:signal transduction histidine kinase
MPGDWTTSDKAADVFSLTLDQRPAWLWSGDGERVVWRNVAAVLFRAKVGPEGLKLAPLPVPIKGQIAHRIRLGSMGRASLSRVRFLAGRKPVSATCLCTPLELGGKAYLLVADTEAVEAPLTGGAFWQTALATDLFDDERAYLIEATDGRELARHGEVPAHGTGRRAFAAGARGRLVLFSPAGETAGDEGGGLTGLFDKLARSETLYTSLPDDESAQTADAGEMTPPPAEPTQPARSPLAPEGGDRYLFALNTEGEIFAGQGDPAPGFDISALRGDRPVVVAADEGRRILAIPIFDRSGARAGWRCYAADEQAEGRGATSDNHSAPAGELSGSGMALWTVTGAGFTPAPPPARSSGMDTAGDAPEDTATPQGEAPVSDRPAARGSKPAKRDRGEDRSRYNFDELARILTDRVGGDGDGDSDDATAPHAAPAASKTTPTTPPAPPGGTGDSAAGGDLVPLSDETLVLNRLPLGLLVFREHSILFANRALADLLGYESTQALREAGLEGLFPAERNAAHAVGPLSELKGEDGQSVPVVARLQTIAWQGRTAYLLSARPGETARRTEAAGITTRAMVELIAAQSNCGFIQLTRTGNIDGISDLGAQLLGPARSVLLGRPLLSYLQPASKPTFAGFLAQSVASAGEAVTVIAEAGAGPVEISLFADRRGEHAEGYLGLVRGAESSVPAEAPTPEAEIGTVLAQISHELRVPLNTILGFSELMLGESGSLPPPARIAEYARDINRAGRQIRELVNELTDLGRFEGGRAELEESEINVGELLEDCVARIRAQANARQVVVRSAVSGALPAILADRTVLSQTVMNMLASAIWFCGRGGNVILSAKQQPEGAIVVHVRDQGGTPPADASDGLVVYRQSDDDGDDQPLRSGTGLALTRSLARANALNLSLDAEPGSGTMMALEIPAEKVVSE